MTADPSHTHAYAAARMSARGFCGIGVFRAKTPANIGTLWRSARALGADFIFTVGERYQRQPSDTTKAWRHVPLYRYRDIDDLIDHLPYDCRLVGVELADNALPLPAVIHPERACYLLGAEDHGLSDEQLARCHDVVVIPGASHCLNVATAGSIVLYDRATKRGE